MTFAREERSSTFSTNSVSSPECNSSVGLIKGSLHQLYTLLAGLDEFYVMCGEKKQCEAFEAPKEAGWNLITCLE